MTMDSTRDNRSIYNAIASYTPEIEVRLHTPAHQGIKGESDYFSDRIYGYDLPFFTRERSHDAEKTCARLYQTQHTFFLTSGATQGILAACTLLGRKHRKVAIALNSHLSILHGFVLVGIEPVFIRSQSLMPTAEEVVQTLETTGGEVTALFLTYPSYDGIVLDLERVARYCRERQIDWVVDEAHGTHFPFFSQNLPSALDFGADLVIHSLHKFAGSLVQTALLHLSPSSAIAEREVREALGLFETTSRSNLLLLSIEETTQLAFSPFRQDALNFARENCDRLRNLLTCFDDVLTYDMRGGDPFKIFLMSDRASGQELEQLLFACGVDCEYSDLRGMLLIFSYQNGDRDFKIVATALEKVHEMLRDRQSIGFYEERHLVRVPVVRCLPKDAYFSPQRKPIDLNNAKGSISCTSIKKIPPCIPALFPGEEITEWHLKTITSNPTIEVMDF